MSKHVTDPEQQHAKKRGFFNAVANRLASARLGDLLVDSGLISRDQLAEALAAQKADRKQLGQVLIGLGIISPITLYRKLAEQWCIKVSAAGLTMLISVGSMAPRSASAETTNVSFSSAVDTSKYDVDEIAYPAMFGTREVRSNDISGFSNWNGMIERFEADLRAGKGGHEMQQMQNRLKGLQGKSLREQVSAVNRMMNSKPYIEDSQNWGKSDYWATPVEFMARGGDCEDFAIAKYVALRALGVPVEQMRVAVVEDKTLNQHHAILIVYDRDKTAYVLDNQIKRVRQLSSVKRYKPIFSINQASWWLHKSA
ncbi:MAG: transglutaminase-like cysteine peptidase [Pseudomonadota bacterium]